MTEILIIIKIALNFEIITKISHRQTDKIAFLYEKKIQFFPSSLKLLLLLPLSFPAAAWKSYIMNYARKILSEA